MAYMFLKCRLPDRGTCLVFSDGVSGTIAVPNVASESFLLSPLLTSFRGMCLIVADGLSYNNARCINVLFNKLFNVSFLRIYTAVISLMCSGSI